MATLCDITPQTINSLGEQQRQATMGKEDLCAHNISEYELSREERIKENRVRMQKLGIFDLSLQFKVVKPTSRRSYQKKTPQAQSPLPPSGPVRRSSRIQNSTPVSYCEVHLPKNENSLKDGKFLREEGSRPEIYTEEHEKKLGSIEKSWTLFVDGYGKDGKRIYDPVKGKTCHQCRQKTLGHRTHCIECNMVQGQFCGDCLYMRYGENVLEANENPNWICPVCRGICNCSLCRQAKGWPPTGTLYRKISSLGYKSVAHYLIQTRRATTDSDKNADVPTSAKRSLPFSDFEITKGDNDHHSKSTGECSSPDPISQETGVSKMAQSNNQVEYQLNPEPEKNADILVDSEPDPISQETGVSKMAQSNDQVEYQLNPEPEKNADILVDSELEEKKNDDVRETKLTMEPLNDHSESLEKGDDNSEIKKENDLILNENDIVTYEKSPKSIKKRVRCESTPDSIAGRLTRRRHNETNTSKNGHL